MYIICKRAKITKEVNRDELLTALNVFSGNEPDYFMDEFYSYVGVTYKQVRKYHQQRGKCLKVYPLTFKKIKLLAHNKNWYVMIKVLDVRDLETS